MKKSAKPSSLKPIPQSEIDRIKAKLSADPMVRMLMAQPNMKCIATRDEKTGRVHLSFRSVDDTTPD